MECDQLDVPLGAVLVTKLMLLKFLAMGFVHSFRNIVTSAGNGTYLIKSVENSTNVFLKSFQIVEYFYL
jgi:hypothetical protein